MPYSVKLKNQTGTEVSYDAIEKISLPLKEDGTATFVARYDVAKELSDGITFFGSDYASHSVDYMCRLSASAVLPTSILVTIDGKEVFRDIDYTYTRINTDAVVQIYGAKITGKISISVQL